MLLCVLFVRYCVMCVVCRLSFVACCSSAVVRCCLLVEGARGSLCVVCCLLVLCWLFALCVFFCWLLLLCLICSLFVVGCRVVRDLLVVGGCLLVVDCWLLLVGC